MNLVDAVKSGKRFRRKSWFKNATDDQWLDVLKLDNAIFSLNDLLAEDWQIEQKSVTITREQFDAAWDKAFYGDTLKDVYGTICEELGL